MTVTSVDEPLLLPLFIKEDNSIYMCLQTLANTIPSIRVLNKSSGITICCSYHCTIQFVNLFDIAFEARRYSFVYSDEKYPVNFSLEINKNHLFIVVPGDVRDSMRNAGIDKK